jgi:hypothetical protein
MSDKDKDEMVLNPITGKLDTVRIFNPNRILTHKLNAAGNPIMIYDPVSGQHITSGPFVVIDNNGNVVTKR